MLLISLTAYCVIQSCKEGYNVLLALKEKRGRLRTVSQKNLHVHENEILSTAKFVITQKVSKI